MAPFLAGLITIMLLYTASRLWLLSQNYRAARTTGLPIIVCPYDPDSLFHAIFSVPLRPALQYILPTSIFATVELSIWGWEFRNKAAVHKKLGPAFIFVTTGLNRLVCADPAMAHDIMTRRKDFTHPEITTKAMGFLGANIVTAKDESWSRQRRIVAPALNERISSDIWIESADQASSLANLLLSSSPPPSVDQASRTIPGLRKIAMNVLARIAYGRHTPFALSSSLSDSSTNMSYVDAISLCTELLVPAAFLPAKLLRLPIMPQLLQTLGAALERLPSLTQDMLNQERKRSCAVSSTTDQTTTATLSSCSNTIMSTLVRLSDQGKDRTDDTTSTLLEKDKARTGRSGAGSSYLSEEEIAGNLFIFTAAGFDTTANTMSYAVALLAAYPEWQVWIQTEIDNVLGGPQEELGAGMPLPEYTTAFPKLVRCLAVMLETLRLFPPVTLLMRSNGTTQNIPFVQSSKFSFLLPAPCTLYVNIVALHTSFSTWGPDALEFNPARWLRPVSEEGAEHVLVTPPRGTFIPWSVGPRTCPGQKMSQVEFVAVIATLFRTCTVKPIVKKGENIQQARDRLLDLMQDSQPVLTLQMNRPQDIHLEWTRR